MQNFFSSDELRQLEALEVRGGNGGISPLSQNKCTNEAKYCGYNNLQEACSNKTELCGTEPDPGLSGGPVTGQSKCG